MENDFIKKSTKTNVIVASVIAGIALISLVMLILLLSPETNKGFLSFLFSIILVFVITFWFGILQIKVFNDYKGQRKYLCAEGIFIICLTVLIVITGILFATIQGATAFGAGLVDTIDIRWFIAVFLLGFSVWKACVVAMSLKEKRFNWWLELAIAVLWVGLSVLTIVSIFSTGDAINSILWGFVIVSWLLIITYITYLLMTYIFKKPTYLETEKAFELAKTEARQKSERLARANAMMGGGYVPHTAEKTETKKDDLETKLKKLDDLLAKNILTKEEYDEKRKQIIKESL